MIRSSRLEALFGKRLDQVAYADVVNLVDNPAAAEAADLDYKEQVHAKNQEQKEEYCKDLAAMGNGIGGILLLGVEEDAAAVPVAVPGVDISDAEKTRLIETALSISPHLSIDIIALPEVPRSLHGIFMITIGRSIAAPHAVRSVGKGQSGEAFLRYPVRNGATTRFMPEPEVAAAYRSRFAEIATRAGRLDTVEKEVIAGNHSYQLRLRRRRGEEDPFPPEQPLLLVSLVPDIPGQMVIDSPTFAEFKQHMLSEPILIGGLGTGNIEATVAPGRLVVAAGGSDRYVYAELHTDGSGSFLQHLAPTPPTTVVPYGMIAEGLLSGLRYLARHASDRTGATGSASLRLRLVASRVVLAKFSSLTVALSDSSTRVSDITVPQALGETSALIEHMADDGSDLVATAGLLASNLSHAFGLVDFPLLTRDGTIAKGNWERHHPALRKWAEKAQIAIV